MKRPIGSITTMLLSSIVLILAGLVGCKKELPTWNPEARMVASPDSGLTTSTIDFTLEILNLPVRPPEFYVRWDLDGDSAWDTPFSASMEQSHRFYQKGLHPVKAEMLTAEGVRVIIRRDIRIGQGYSAPHVAFTVNPPNGHYQTLFTFDASPTFDDEDPFSSLKFRWDFDGDGAWDTEYSNNPVATYKYPLSLTYDVKLSVTDPTNRAASLSKKLSVSRLDPKILVKFTWTPVHGAVRDTFLLDASSTRHSEDSDRVFSYMWNVHNEVFYGPYSEPLFRHRFWYHGSQKITLTVTDQQGLYNTYTEELYVLAENKPPEPEITISTRYGNITTQFYLDAWGSRDDATPPSKLLIRWDFEGDGHWDTGWSKEKSLFHQFNEPGDYRITLQAQDEGGETGLGHVIVQVSQYPNPTGFFKDPRNDKYYGTVKIGNLWWMSDNLDYRMDPKMHTPMLQKCYEGWDSYCDQFGALYQGERAHYYLESGRQICPTGWRVPTRDDWMALKSHTPESGGRDALMPGGSLGFNAQLTGYADWHYEYNILFWWIIMDTIYNYYGMDQEVQFLSSTIRANPQRLSSQFYMGLIRQYDGAEFRWGNLDGFYYLRCVRKDE